jgi:membrane associated rhomboid family serine protease
MATVPVLCFTLLGIIMVLGVLGLTVAPGLSGRLLLRPYDVARGRRRWSVVTSAFVHADFPHLLFNSMTLWFFGPGLERIIGSPRFGLLYAIGLALSPWQSLVKHRDDPQYATLGASGAISAVLFASIVYRPLDRLMILPIPVPIPAPLFAVGYLAYTWWSARQQRGRINHDAHLGGAIAGLVFVALTDPLAYARAAALLGS